MATEGCVCKSLKADKSRWISSTGKLFIHMDRSYKEEQCMYESFFGAFLLFKIESTEMLVTSVKFALMDCYGH